MTSSSSCECPTSGDLLDEKFLLLQVIGKGSFAQVFQARNIYNGEIVAIKLGVGPQASLKRESDVLKVLAKGNSRFPAFHGYVTQPSGVQYIVMELLGGDNMSAVRERTRGILNSSYQQRNSSGELLPVPIRLSGASYLAHEMLLCTQALHSAGFVHRDIKPANFVHKLSQTTTNKPEFCLLDFGVAKQIVSEEGDASASHGFRGTTMYASTSAHSQLPQGPKDDVWSLLFVFIDLVVGRLPWSEAARNWQAAKRKLASSSETLSASEEPDSKRPRLGSECFKQEVFTIKSKYTSGAKEDASLVDWVMQEAGVENSDVNDKLKHCINTFVEHLAGLDSKSLPDYSLLLGCMDDLHKSSLNQSLMKSSVPSSSVDNPYGIAWKEASSQETAQTSYRLPRNSLSWCHKSSLGKDKRRIALLKILELRSKRLLEEVTTLRAKPSDDLHQLQSVACDWYVLAESFMTLVPHSGPHSSEADRNDAVLSGILRRMGVILEKVDMFALLGVHALSHRQGGDEATTEDLLSWKEFLELQQMIYDVKSVSVQDIEARRFEIVPFSSH